MNYSRDETSSKIDTILKSFKENPSFSANVSEIIGILPKESLYENLHEPLPDCLEQILTTKNIRLYSHQCESIENIRSGHNIILGTSTASGKTYAFNLPIFESFFHHPNATALYIYPTKALARDQLLSLEQIENESGISINPGVYDGDTTKENKNIIKKNSRIVLTNPDMLNRVLPWHRQWSRVLSNLQFVVIDEAHSYRGVFGSNVALIIRRLRRLCSYYGSNPQFILASATLANSLEFAQKLTGLDFIEIAKDGAPHGSKHLIFYNPFICKDAKTSTDNESAKLLVHFVINDLQTICFTNSRKRAEIIADKAKNDESFQKFKQKYHIAAYRAGYLPEERTTIEKQIKNNEVQGIVSTNALELGIDIGSLDASIISGYPGTIMSMVQQAGRAGRKTTDSIAVFVAFNSPLDQHFMNNPYLLLSASNEHAVVSLTNPIILNNHLLSAANELPLQLNRDEKYFGEAFTSEYLDQLSNNGKLEHTEKGFVYRGYENPAMMFNIRNVRPEIFIVQSGGKTLETLDITQVYREAYKGAIIIHQGEQYLVREIDFDGKLINADKVTVDFSTRPIMDKNLVVVNVRKKRKLKDVTLYFGDVQITLRTIGNKKIRDDKVISQTEVNLPPLTFNTTAIWFEIPEDIIAKFLSIDSFVAGLHGIENGLSAVAPYFIMCDRRDLGGFNNSGSETGLPRVFLYDDYEGSIGLSEYAFKIFEQIVKMTYEVIRNCNCEHGCNACIYSSRLSDNNRDLDKNAALQILRRTLPSMGIESELSLTPNVNRSLDHSRHSNVIIDVQELKKNINDSYE